MKQTELHAWLQAQGVKSSDTVQVYIYQPNHCQQITCEIPSGDPCLTQRRQMLDGSFLSIFASLPTGHTIAPIY